MFAPRIWSSSYKWAALWLLFSSERIVYTETGSQHWQLLQLRTSWKTEVRHQPGWIKDSQMKTGGVWGVNGNRNTMHKAMKTRGRINNVVLYLPERKPYWWHSGLSLPSGCMKCWLTSDPSSLSSDLPFSQYELSQWTANVIPWLSVFC